MISILALDFPAIDPVAVQIGPIAIRWYALAYIAGILGGWYYLRQIVRKPPHAMTAAQVDDFVVWATLGVVLGGRLGYVLFYKPGHYAQHPWEILYLWEGGMSFHGGLLGVVAAMLLFCRVNRLNLFAVGDAVCCVVPIGLFFGRLANFINGELYGRITDVPWAMVFPHGGPWPRHPSQLYQAALEGLALFALLYLMQRSDAVRMRPGLLAGTFLIGYAVARSVGELFREPDPFLGFIIGGITMGQLLSLPMLIAGLVLVWWAQRRARP